MSNYGSVPSSHTRCHGLSFEQVSFHVLVSIFCVCDDLLPPTNITTGNSSPVGWSATRDLRDVNFWSL